jgi:hypothetical protein
MRPASRAGAYSSGFPKGIEAAKQIAKRAPERLAPGRAKI